MYLPQLETLREIHNLYLRQEWSINNKTNENDVITQS